MHFDRFLSLHGSAAMPKIAAIICAAALTCGCAPERSAVREDFGNSVRAMIAAQTYEPGKEAAGLDGDKAITTLGNYRKDVPKPAATTEGTIQINIGK